MNTYKALTLPEGLTDGVGIQPIFSHRLHPHSRSSRPVVVVVRDNNSNGLAAPGMRVDVMGDNNVCNTYTGVFETAMGVPDDLLHVMCMQETGPVIDRLSSEMGMKLLHVVAKFLPDREFSKVCLEWLQKLLDMINKNGTDVVGIPMELKKEILINLNKAPSIVEPEAEDGEGILAAQLLLQLASAWGIDLQQPDK